MKIKETSMKVIFRLTTILFIGYHSHIAVAQTTDNVQHAVPSFGGLTGGTISVGNHLGDTLAFTDSLVNQRFVSSSFNLALKCNGNVIKYMENKKGNTLTQEMKEAVLSLHQNCTLNLDGIKSRSRQKDPLGKYTETRHKAMVLRVK